MISKIVLKNFKCFQTCTIELNPGLNILVGPNEAGKSTILEAVNLALTGRVGRYPVGMVLTPHMLNVGASREYVETLRAGGDAKLPEAYIELYLEEDDHTVALKGRNNSLDEDTPGIRLWLHFDEDYNSEYRQFLKHREDIQSVPMEYYKSEWLAFSDAALTRRKLKVSASLVDASKIRLRSGADYYLQRIIEESLTGAERVRLARAYADLKEQFANSEGVATINTALLDRKAEITDKNLSLSIDASPTAAWETSLIPYLDDLPFDHAGGGEQSTLKILLALTRTVDGSHIILIEEPENHLSFPVLNQLAKKIEELCTGKQLILTTHSSFILNKLGLISLLLLRPDGVAKITDLPPDTQDYFKKLPGYDTLRVILADTVILVEGPSDELVVQRAYKDEHGVLPLQRRVDVVSVRGLAFKRFLDIAVQVGTRVRVVTDNDGKPEAVSEKYEAYSTFPNIKVCFDDDARLPTLEPSLVAVNSLEDLNSVLGTFFTSKDAVREHMQKPANKTDAALKIFESDRRLKMPQYILDAIVDV